MTPEDLGARDETPSLLQSGAHRKKFSVTVLSQQSLTKLVFGSIPGWARIA